MNLSAYVSDNIVVIIVVIKFIFDFLICLKYHRCYLFFRHL